LYAGDILGNVWRFDVTSTNVSDWLAAPPVKIYSVPEHDPITTKVLINRMKGVAGDRIVVQFATGRAWPLLRKSGNAYATGTHSVYGVWDWHFSAWNHLSSVQMAALPEAEGPVMSRLATRVLGPDQVVNGTRYRVLQSTPVCWRGELGTTGCNSYLAEGWQLALPAVGGTGFREQVVFDPQLVNGVMVVNTLAPGWPLATSQGFTMTIGADGDAPVTSFFGGASGLSQVMGAELQGLGTPVFFTGANKQTRMYQQDINHTPTVTDVTLPPPVSYLRGRRLTWVQLR